MLLYLCVCVYVCMRAHFFKEKKIIALSSSRKTTLYLLKMIFFRSNTRQKLDFYDNKWLDLVPLKKTKERKKQQLCTYLLKTILHTNDQTN